MSIERQAMDPRDAETAKWLGNVIDAGESSHYLPASNLTHDQVTATSAAAIASEGKTGTVVVKSQTTIARVAAVEATNDVQLAAPIVGQSRSKSSNLVASGSSNSVSNTAAHRASRLAASGAKDALYHPRQAEVTKASRLSSAGAAASLAAEGRTSTTRQSQQRLNDLALEKSAASRAAILAARDSAPYEIPEHALSANAGKAALLAAHDHKEYEVPVHQLSANAGKAALLASKDHVEYEVPEHELSANAGKAALMAAHDHKEYEVPVHELSANAGTAALLAHQDHREYEVPPHQLSANAGKAALLAHHDHKEYEVPPHTLSANAGKAAILAHQDHKEYQVPAHTLSSNAGKAALLAHRDTVPAPRVDQGSAAGAASALKAATQAHHDPAMRPTKPEDLQAKGAANALRAATQAHKEAPPPFKYVHPSDDPEIGKLARSNTQAYLTEMDPRAPHPDTLRYANLSYAAGKNRESRADEYRAISDEAYRSAGLAYNIDSRSDAGSSRPVRSRTNTASTINKAPVDLMALARRNVDAQMAERGLTRTDSQQTISTVGAANMGANLAFREGKDRQAEWDRQREISREEREISERINREMAQFDQQRRRNQNSSQVQSALMEAAKRNARQSMAQMEANRPYSAPNLRDTQRMEDLLNDKKMAARRDQQSGAMVDLGGGHFMSQVEIEAVAARRVQPVFEEMDEQVAEINRRKAELQAQRDAEAARRDAESAERRQQREVEKERSRNTKEAEKKAKAEAKAKRAEEKEKADMERRERQAAHREEVRRQREETLEKAAAERRQRQEESVAAFEAERHTSQAATSPEAVATAGVASETPRKSTSSERALPGTNAPIAGQEAAETNHTADLVAPTTPSKAVAGEGSQEQTPPELHRSETAETEIVATYVVETQGMTTDTEGETDDEWTDAMEETPAIERAEYFSISQLTNDNLAAREPIREESTDDAETASISTARPNKTSVTSEEPELAPPLGKIINGSGGGHEHTRFKEELA